jgi:hypothetical protein
MDRRFRIWSRKTRIFDRRPSDIRPEEEKQWGERRGIIQTGNYSEYLKERRDWGKILERSQKYWLSGSRLAAIFARLEFSGLLYLARFAGASPEVEFKDKSSSTARSVIESCLKKAGYM